VLRCTEREKEKNGSMSDEFYVMLRSILLCFVCCVVVVVGFEYLLSKNAGKYQQNRHKNEEIKGTPRAMVRSDSQRS
jgi:hypothetical protein